MFEKLSEYIDNELDELDCETIEGHAESCMNCKACLETLKRTSDLCGALPEREIPADFSQRLRALVEEMTGQ